MLTAHIDTLGAMVKNITSEGRLKYNKIKVLGVYRR